MRSELIGRKRDPFGNHIEMRLIEIQQLGSRPYSSGQIFRLKFIDKPVGFRDKSGNHWFVVAHQPGECPSRARQNPRQATPATRIAVFPDGLENLCDKVPEITWDPDLSGTLCYFPGDCAGTPDVQFIFQELPDSHHLVRRSICYRLRKLPHRLSTQCSATAAAQGACGPCAASFRLRVI